MSFAKPELIIQNLGVTYGQSVADIGAGTGVYTFLLSKMVGSSGSVYAIEIQKELVARITKEAEEKNITNIHAIWADAENVGGTGIRAGAVDAVLVSNVLFQTESKSGLVHEIKRILKQGGKVLIVDWSESFAGLGPVSQQVVTEETARELFENNGFSLEKKFEAGAHHYGLVFRHTVL